jgi:hypothetical protein
MSLKLKREEKQSFLSIRQINITFKPAIDKASEKVAKFSLICVL